MKIDDRHGTFYQFNMYFPYSSVIIMNMSMHVYFSSIHLNCIIFTLLTNIISTIIKIY